MLEIDNPKAADHHNDNRRDVSRQFYTKPM